MWDFIDGLARVLGYLSMLGFAVIAAIAALYWLDERLNKATPPGRYCPTGAHDWLPDDPDWDDDTCPWHADVLRAYDEELR